MLLFLGILGCVLLGMGAHIMYCGIKEKPQYFVNGSNGDGVGDILLSLFVILLGAAGISGGWLRLPFMALLFIGGAIIVSLILAIHNDFK